MPLNTNIDPLPICYPSGPSASCPPASPPWSLLANYTGKPHSPNVGKIHPIHTHCQPASGVQAVNHSLALASKHLIHLDEAFITHSNCCHHRCLQPWSTSCCWHQIHSHLLLCSWHFRQSLWDKWRWCLELWSFQLLTQTPSNSSCWHHTEGIKTLCREMVKKRLKMTRLAAGIRHRDQSQTSWSAIV